MKLKIIVLSIFLLVCSHAHGSSAATAQARSQANALAGQIEKLIKEDAVGNADEISRLEKQLQSNINSLKKSGQQKIAGELSLRLSQLQGSKIEADVNDIAQSVQQIRSSTEEDAKGKLAKLEKEMEALQKEIRGQVDALKGALDENQQLQQKLSAAEHHARGKDAEIAALKEDLKKMPATTGGAAQSTNEDELAQARQTIVQLKKQLDDLQARENLRNTTAIENESKIKGLEKEVETLRKNLAEKGNQTVLSKDDKARIKQLLFEIADSRTSEFDKSIKIGQIGEMLK